MSTAGERQANPGVVRAVVDWRLAAELLARGLSITKAARQVGCSRSQLSRRRNHDPLFQAWVRESAASLPPVKSRRSGSLRQRLHDAIDAEVQGGNVRVILWLADRLKLVSPPDKTKSNASLQALLQGMTEDDLKEFESLTE